jgi:polar amino acid transport system substrate-binding protein
MAIGYKRVPDSDGDKMKQKRSIRCRWALGGLAAFHMGMAQAQSMCLDRPIRFAHYEFGMIYSSGYGGIDDDLQKEMAQRTGCKFEVSVRPRARTWLDLKQGSLDMAGSGIQTAERDEFAWFHHYIVEDNVVVLGPKVPLKTRNFDQFMADPKLTLGGVRSYRYSPHYDRYVDQLLAQNRHVESADPGALYRMFSVPRFDAFITNPILYLYYVKQLNLTAPTRVEDWDPAGPTPSGLVLSKKSFSKAQAAQWGGLIEKMLEDGSIQRIVVKHMGAELGAKAVYRAPPR